MNIIEKIRQENLRGRGGAGFPTADKWQAVKDAPGHQKYVICNASEGELDVHKDKFILENFTEDVVTGIKIALDTIPHSQGYIYLKKEYYTKFKEKLENIITDTVSRPHPNPPLTREGDDKQKPPLFLGEGRVRSNPRQIELFCEIGGYLSGEETTLINSIEGKRAEPRSKPPFPTTHGLFNCPTLINNVETFWAVAKIAKDEYQNTRFISIVGDVDHTGVFEVPEDLSIRGVLELTHNHPSIPFFIQDGGGASGRLLDQANLDQPIEGTGAIVIYHRDKHSLLEAAQKWIDFFYAQNCGKCVSCREGVYRLKEALDKGIIDINLFTDLINVLRETSFCPLGKSIAVPMGGLLELTKPI